MFCGFGIFVLLTGNISLDWFVRFGNFWMEVFEMKLFKIEFSIETGGVCLVLAENAEQAIESLIEETKDTYSIKSGYYVLEIDSVEEVDMNERKAFWFGAGLYD